MLNVFNKSLLLKSEKLSIKYFIFILIILISTFGIFIYLKKYNYYSFYNMTGITDKGNISINIYDNYLNEISKTSKVIIDEKEYAYEIVSLSSPSLDLNNNVYYSMVINIKDYDYLDNKVVSIRFKYGQTNLLKNFLKVIKEG